MIVYDKEGNASIVRSTTLIKRIVRWEVWFRTPAGLLTTPHAAALWCVANDLNPDLLVCPTAVAIAEDGDYEPVMR